MELWNFIHENTPFHLYEFFALVVMAVMAVIFAVHMIKNRKDSAAENGRVRTSEIPEEEEK